MVVMMNDFGNSLITRTAGKAAYEAISSKMTATDEVTVFDFSNIDSITNSFADEVFGRMAFELGIDRMREATTFRNIAPFGASVIRSVIDARNADRVFV